MRKTASLLVASLSFSIAVRDFSGLREATYTFALCKRRALRSYGQSQYVKFSLVVYFVTLAVSYPMPLLAPVTIITFPERSGMLSTVYLGSGGKLCLMNDIMMPMT